MSTTHPIVLKFEPAPPLPHWIERDFPFERRIFHGGGWRMHFVDQGEGAPVLLQHGNPTWSFLWRKVIDRLLPEGVRVIAPDLIGLGLSDKPRDEAVHTLDFHAEQLGRLVEALDLREITIVGQDWGGPIVAKMAARHPERIHGAVFANTALSAPRKQPRTTRFHRFSNLPVVSDFAFRILNFPIPVLDRVQGDAQSIGRPEQRAYRYPLRYWRDRTAPLALARMVPTTLDHPTVASDGRRWRSGRARSVGRFGWSGERAIRSSGGRSGGMRELFPNAPVTGNRALATFLQEEVPEVLADRRFWRL